MAARSWTARILDQKKLHCLAGPTLLGVLAPTERSRDADAEVRGQRPAAAEVGGQRPADVEIEGQRSEGQRDPESELGGPRPAGSRPALEDK